MKVACTITEDETDGDHGHPVPSICATCSRCHHRVESFGVDDRSIRRCMVLMRQQCPNGESNFYVEGSSQ